MESALSVEVAALIYVIKVVGHIFHKVGSVRGIALQVFGVNLVCIRVRIVVVDVDVNGVLSVCVTVSD